jgi:Cyclic nucleotide-binding domain
MLKRSGGFAVRFESSVLSVSWLPSEAISGMTRLPFDIGVTRYDDPPADVMHNFRELLGSDNFRFANELRAWVEVEDGRISNFGYSGQGHINVSTIRLGRREVAFAAVPLPDIQHPPVVASDSVTFTQTAGGRTGLPAPRRVRRAPYVQFAAPLVWTTLSLTIDNEGNATSQVVGASPFPRHWIYDESMSLLAKTGTIDFKSWYREAFGKHTPWGTTDSPAFVTEVETALERELSHTIMRGGAKPERRNLSRGEKLVEQGERGEALFLLLDGVLAVDVDGERLAELGPGAILGERALLEGGTRTSTLVAVTPCRLSVASADQIDPKVLEEISRGHRREES